MANLATTKMSSKGQIVIPEEIRKRLNLKTGAQFVVVGDNDVASKRSLCLRNFVGVLPEGHMQAPL